MKWSFKRPTVPGWYWLKQRYRGEADEPRIVQVRDYGGMAIGNSTIDGKWMDGAKWAGPIPLPR